MERIEKKCDKYSEMEISNKKGQLYVYFDFSLFHWIPNEVE